jgi:mono/diheme cytochrome c family protein
MILAQSATRNIGVVILAVVIIGFLVYLFFNLLETRGEGGAEIELAANRKPYHSDDILETTKLDQSLLSGLFLLSVIGLALPLYWLGEPGRQEGLVENTLHLWTEDGAEAFEESCSSCHGGGGAGGIASFAITEQGTGAFVASVDWVAPSLTSLLTRFSEEEVIHTLNFGRNGVMPAWGAPGGGPLTAQQLEVIVVYLRSVQKDADAVQVAVTDGLIAEARDEWVSRDPELSARFLGAKQDLARAQQTGINSVISDAQANLSDLQREIGETFPNAQMAAWLDEISDPSHEEYLTYGKLLFVNRADSGAYSCARCHTAGWSYEGALDLDLAGNPVTTVTDADGNEAAGYLQGGGWFGPNLTNGAEVTQFPNEDTHIDFIRKGSEDGVRYGVAGQGSGQMPGFSNRLDDDLVEIDEFGEEVSKNWPASLTEEQIAAVVAYARSL